MHVAMATLEEITGIMTAKAHEASAAVAVNGDLMHSHTKTRIEARFCARRQRNDTCNGCSGGLIDEGSHPKRVPGPCQGPRLKCQRVRLLQSAPGRGCNRAEVGALLLPQFH